MFTTEIAQDGARPRSPAGGFAASARRHAWWIVGLVYVAGTIAYFFVPTVAQSEMPAVGGILAAAAYVGGALLHRPRHQLHWWLLGIGVFLLAAGDTVWALWEDFVEPEVPFPSIPDALYLGAYPFILASLLVLTSKRLPHRDVTSLLDATVVAIGSGFAVWVFLIDPLSQSDADTGARVVSALYPAIDVALIAVASRLAFAGGRRVPSYWALVAALVITVVADIAYGLAEVTGAYDTGSWTDAAYLLAYGAWAVVALHPSMRELHDAAPDSLRARRVSSARLALLGIGCLAAPAVMAVQLLRDEPLHLPIAIAVFSGLLVLVVVRLGGLMRALSNVALHDALTGLPNRAALHERLGDLVRDTPPGHLAVMFVDLDRFKDINDSLGHAAGDRMLVEVAARLRFAMRGSDMVARFGGDEFVIVASVRDTTEGGRIAGRVLSCLNDPIWLDGSPVFPGASVGVAINRGDDDPDLLVADADIAMFQAKAQGRARYEIFDESMRGGAVERLTIEAELRVAIANDELHVHYQPIAQTTTRNVVGYEALLRWHHPNGEIRTPAQFLSVAEDTGLVVPIGERVICDVLADMGRWHARRPDRRATVSVNISEREIKHPGFVRLVREELRRNDVEPSHLFLEVTELVLVDDETVRVLSDLRDIGVRLAIDDFGTGYSSLQRLRRTRFDALKIDRSYVSALDDPDNRAIVQAILAMINALGMIVVAEGVETEAQLEVLRDLGCPLVQGHLIGQPEQLSRPARRRHAGDADRPHHDADGVGDRPVLR